MPNTNTEINIGIAREFPTLGMRNFEDDGLHQYACNYQDLTFNGVTYDVGDHLPFDVGGTHYSADAIETLRLFWDQEWITPLT